MITNEQKWREAKRELTTRKQVYRKWVADGKLTKELADVRIDIMEAIVSDYEQYAPKPAITQPELF